MLSFLIGALPFYTLLPGQEVDLVEVVEVESLPDRFHPYRYNYNYKDFVPSFYMEKRIKKFRAKEPGIYRVPYMSGADTALILVMVPFDQIPERLRRSYPNPYRRGRRSVAVHPDRYLPPKGFILVTQENETTRISEHFRLGDFTRRASGLPQWITIDPKLIMVLEAIADSLEARGLGSNIKVLSGYRPPWVNRRKGRRWSRHQYGDAADIYVDNDNNGVMDDLNGDGRITTRDAIYLAKIAEAALRDLGLEGGVGYYRGRRRRSGPFIHVDTRGFTSRWHW